MADEAHSMRNLVFLDKPLEDYKRGLAKVERSNKSWKGSHLRTNLLWLHFFLHELYLKIPSYFGTMNNSPDRELANNRHATIEHAFRAIDARLSLKDFHKNGLGSVRDLVLWALEEGWLDPEDVSGNQTSVEELEARMRNLGIARGNESIVADSGEDPTREKDKRRRTRVRLKS